MKMLRTYHDPDHASMELSTSLGSSSWITDKYGNAIQHLHYLPFGEDWVDQRNSSWNAPYTFSGKEKDVETGYHYFGARYYDSGLSIWLSVDPMADERPWENPYSYCANNPIIRIDPTGMIWKDSDGNEVKDHSNVKVYIFYSPKEGIFSESAKTMYAEAEAKYGKGSVVMSDVTTTSDFAKDWGDMASPDIREVNLNYHGGTQTLNLDPDNNQYLTSTGTGATPKNNPALNVESLSTPKGDVSKAQLNINSCQSNNNANLPKGSNTLAQAFSNSTNFFRIRTTAKGVSYFRLFSPNAPHPEDHSDWQYLRKFPTPKKHYWSN